MSYAPTSASSARMTTGEVYKPRPASTGLCGVVTCSRCGALVAISQLERDKHPMFKGKTQRRHIDREACAIAKGGKS